jgi:hypothetical protein
VTNDPLQNADRSLDGEPEQFLSDAEQFQRRRLVAEIRRSRDGERGAPTLIERAAELAADNQFAQSREVALQAMAGCTDGPLVARLRHLLQSLPHPMGRLIYGFDSSLEVEQVARPHDGARVEVLLNESHPLGGGFARLYFPAAGSRVDLLGPPPDWSDGKELIFMAQLASRVRTAFRVSVGDLRNAWTADLTLMDYYWNPQRLALERFAKQGEPDWSAVTQLSITSLTPEPTAIHLDEVRLRPAAPRGGR